MFLFLAFAVSAMSCALLAASDAVCRLLSVELAEQTDSAGPHVAAKYAAL